MDSPGRTQHGIYGAILQGVVKAWNDEGASRPSGSTGSVEGVWVHGSPYLGYLCFGGKLALIHILPTLLPTPVRLTLTAEAHSLLPIRFKGNHWTNQWLLS